MLIPSALRPLSPLCRFDSDGFPVAAAAVHAAGSTEGDEDESEDEVALGAGGAAAALLFKAASPVAAREAPGSDWQAAVREEVRRGGASTSSGVGGAGAAGRLSLGAGRMGAGGKGRPQSANQKFLNRYSLSNSGLFAPM